jgi:hypothetical protein
MPGAKQGADMNFVICFGPDEDRHDESYQTLKETADRCRELLEKHMKNITIEHRGKVFTTDAILSLSP